MWAMSIAVQALIPLVRLTRGRSVVQQPHTPGTRHQGSHVSKNTARPVAIHRPGSRNRAGPIDDFELASNCAFDKTSPVSLETS